MYTAANRESNTPVAFPVGLEVHWETENRIMWNERDCVSEKQELIYEVSWISELGLWRRFLIGQRKV